MASQSLRKRSKVDYVSLDRGDELLSETEDEARMGKEAEPGDGDGDDESMSKEAESGDGDDEYGIDTDQYSQSEAESDEDEDEIKHRKVGQNITTDPENLSTIKNLTREKKVARHPTAQTGTSKQENSHNSKAQKSNKDSKQAEEKRQSTRKLDTDGNHYIYLF